MRRPRQISKKSTISSPLSVGPTPGPRLSPRAGPGGGTAWSSTSRTGTLAGVAAVDAADYGDVDYSEFVNYDVFTSGVLIIAVGVSNVDVEMPVVVMARVVWRA